MLDKDSIAEIMRLEELKHPVKKVMQEVSELIAPHLMDFDGTHADRFLFSPGHYSGAGKLDLEVYARGMFSHMVGGDVDFMEAGVFNNDEIMQDKPSQGYFERVRLELIEEMYSNGWFDHVKPSLEYCGAVGTDVTTIMGDYYTNKISIIHWHPGDVFIGEDGSGWVDRLALKIRTTPKDLMDMGVDLPISLQNEANKPKPARKKLELWAYWRKQGPKATKQTGMPFKYRLLMKDGTILSESLMHSLPGPVWRMEKMPRSAYGLSMGIKLYRDLMQSNKIQKLLMEEAELRVRPPVWVPNTAEDIFMEPGSINYVNSMDGSQFPRRMIDAADMLPASQLKQEIDSLARVHFYTDFFMQLTGSTNRKTSVEVQGLMMESGAQIASLVDSFERNYLMPSVRRHFILMAEQGRLSEPSNKIKEYIAQNPQAELGVRFIGPLAKARRWMYSVGKDLEMINQMVVPLAQVDPGVLDYIDMAALLGRAKQFMSGGRNVLRTQEEVDQMRQKQAEAQQAAQQQAYQMEVLKMTKAPEPGSPAAALADK